MRNKLTQPFLTFLFIPLIGCTWKSNRFSLSHKEVPYSTLFLRDVFRLDFEIIRRIKLQFLSNKKSFIDAYRFWCWYILLTKCLRGESIHSRANRKGIVFTLFRHKWDHFMLKMIYDFLAVLFVAEKVFVVINIFYFLLKWRSLIHSLIGIHIISVIELTCWYLIVKFNIFCVMCKKFSEVLFLLKLSYY